jgi:hypothetical protein
VTYDQGMLDVIDERIRTALAGLPGLHPATMTARDTTGPGGTATFFGTGTSTPVKVPASVHAFEGDRVGLARFGKSDWVVVYCYTRWGDSEAGINSVVGNDTTTSGTYSAIAGIPTFTWRKRYDETRVSLRMTAGLFSATFPAQGEYAMQLDDGTTATDYFLIRLRTDAGGHVSASAEDIFPAVPAGLYTVTARWRKTSGGTMQLNNVDTVAMRCREIGPLHP